jgi:hypothetical protein
MTDKQGTQGTPFDVASCAAMMEEMMKQMSAGDGCAEMMSQPKNQAGRGCCNCSEMMSQMRTMWGKTQGKTDQPTRS